jgi:hypothetical protein
MNQVTTQMMRQTHVKSQLLLPFTSMRASASFPAPPAAEPSPRTLATRKKEKYGSTRALDKIILIVDAA